MASTAPTPTIHDDVDAPTARSAGLSVDEVYHLLQNERRRLALRHLLRNGESDLDAITDHVAATENDTAVEELNEQERKRVYISLYQSHLPALADHGVVDYDEDSGVVTPTETIGRFERYLVPTAIENRRRVPDLDRRNAVATLLLVAGGLLLAATQFSGVGTLGLVATFVAGGSLTVVGLIGISMAAKDDQPGEHR